MKKIIFLLVFLILITITACGGNNCKELLISFRNHNEAKEIVINSTFKFSHDADVTNSLWISSAKYFSCDVLWGFLVIKTGSRTYVHQEMPMKFGKVSKRQIQKAVFIAEI
jgi:hypothetical protein